MKPDLTVPLIKEAAAFCRTVSGMHHAALRGVTDGKAIGTYVELMSKDHLARKYRVGKAGASAGIDLPSPKINTDIKATSKSHPQSSSPFRSAEQKIFGLGYNILLFIYEKKDSRKNNLKITGCAFISKSRTADYQTTGMIRGLLKSGAGRGEILALLSGRNIPADSARLGGIADRVMRRAPDQGYLTVSNALQWRLRYGRVAKIADGKVDGVERIL